MQAVMSEEIWKTVPSVPWLMASSFGRVRTIPFKKPMPNGGFRTYGGFETYGIVEKQNNRFFYRIRGRSFGVSRLVCEAFHGSPSEEGLFCLHLDEDPQNNRADNLKWGTQKENLNAPKYLAHCRTRFGEKSMHAIGRRKLLLK